jgi:hypothetical protein
LASVRSVRNSFVRQLINERAPATMPILVLLIKLELNS